MKHESSTIIINIIEKKGLGCSTMKQQQDYDRDI